MEPNINEELDFELTPEMEEELSNGLGEDEPTMEEGDE